ncbi:hypothetical protein GCM10028802_07950 [Terrabacter terrigena]
MTMSTNLGWPSEPDPEPEHRRLGWLARMLGVSRETNGQAIDHPSTVDSAPASTTGVMEMTESVPTTEPSLIVEDTVVAAGQPAATGSDLADGRVTHPSSGDDSGDRAGGASDGDLPVTLPDLLPGADSTTDSTTDANVEPPVDPAAASGRDLSAEPETTEVPIVQTDAEPTESSVVAEPTVAGEAESMPGHVAQPPVDNAVDEAGPMGVSERESSSYGAGDNVVDESLEAVRQRVDHADREALAAALPTPGTDTPLARELAENARRRIQLTGRPFPKPASPRVLTVANQKGGVGKTTTTVNVAAALAQAGLTVLVIDLDPQGNASTALGIDHHAEVPSIYDVLVDGSPLLDVVQPCSTVENLHCAPATIDLAGAEIELVSLVARESRLQKAIAAAAEQGHEFDYILIDCPPSLGLLTVNAMVAASEVFIPIQCEYYALEGLSQLLKNIDLVKRHLNPALHVSTILLTMYDGRTRLSAQVADEVREHFPEQVLRTTVPRSVRVSEAPSFGETVMTYDPASSGALAYLEAAGELADRGAAVDV